jgi:hypothetical protein
LEFFFFIFDTGGNLIYPNKALQLVHKRGKCRTLQLTRTTRHRHAYQQKKKKLGFLSMLLTGLFYNARFKPFLVLGKDGLKVATFSIPKKKKILLGDWPLAGNGRAQLPRSVSTRLIWSRFHDLQRTAVLIKQRLVMVKKVHIFFFDF